MSSPSTGRPWVEALKLTVGSSMQCGSLTIHKCKGLEFEKAGRRARRRGGIASWGDAATIGVLRGHLAEQGGRTRPHACRLRGARPAHPVKVHGGRTELPTSSSERRQTRTSETNRRMATSRRSRRPVLRSAEVRFLYFRS